MPEGSTFYASSDFCTIAGFQTGKNIVSATDEPLEDRADKVGLGSLLF